MATTTISPAVLAEIEAARTELAAKLTYNGRTNIKNVMLYAALDPEFGLISDIENDTYTVLPSQLLDKIQDLGLVNARQYCNENADRPRYEVMESLKRDADAYFFTAAQFINRLLEHAGLPE